MSRSRMVPIFSALIAALMLSTAPARADEAYEISRILKQGQPEKALERANSYLATHPKDAKVRFLKGLIQTEQNKTGDAIKTFTSITEDHPELPEPYNNLAVLYASQGQYEKAKIALEMAINTHPSYATAHENLGDIYAKMASQAYDKALQLDKSNANAQSKLALIKDIFSKKGDQPPVKPNMAAKSVLPPAAPAVAAQAKAVAQVEPAKAIPVAATPAPAAKPAAESTKAPAEKLPPEAKSADDAIVLATVEAWARAWSEKDVTGYLKFYAPDLVLAKGESRKSWEQTRRERISKPKSISVTIASPDVKLLDASNAKVTFKQQYRSTSLNSETWKSLVMVKSNGKWLIHEERIGR